VEPNSHLEATPEKRIFWSIISDYGLRTGVCELVDNAIDLWKRNGAKKALSIDIWIDTEQQQISIKDNAGGVREADLPKLVTPGGSQNEPDAHSIGIFGVGSKRAGVALGQEFKIKTRYLKEKTFLIIVNDDWLNDTSWEIPSYVVANISPGSTQVEISRLRSAISENEVDALRAHLSSVYGKFLLEDVNMRLNGDRLDATTFNNWSYPPEAPPREFEFPLELEDLGKLHIDIKAGLIAQRDPEAADYGVYIYCNDRLVVKHWKERPVGYFVSTEAGVPHPDASLARVIVSLNGPARAMPWNSSKDGINTTHKIFKALQKQIVELSGYYTKASRRWKNEWDERVFKYKQGSVERVALDDGPPTKLRLPPTPSGTRHYATSIKKLNSGLIRTKPWVLGLIEAMAAAKWMTTQKYATKNRMALILLDSNLEIAFKEFIVNNKAKFPPKQYNDATLAGIINNRSDAIYHVSKLVKISKTEVQAIESFYIKRNKLIHERATVDVSSEEIEIYREIVEGILRKLFKVRFPG